MCLLVALVLHAQPRSFQGMQAWWALADLRWAFDTADMPSMKVAAFRAGVCRDDWLLLDDILDQDRQCVGLMGLASAVFALGAGTAQGRRFSVHVFNGMLKWLADEVDTALPNRCAGWLPPFARRVLDAAERVHPASDLASPPLRPQGAAAVRNLAALRSASEGPPWSDTECHVLAAVAQMPAAADRAAAIEALGSLTLPPLAVCR